MLTLYRYRCPNCREDFESRFRTRKFCSRSCSTSAQNCKGNARAIKISKTIKRRWKNQRAEMMAGLDSRNYSNTIKHVRKLWAKKSFREKIVRARKRAGYKTDPNAPVRASLRMFCKRSIRRCLNLFGGEKGDSVIRVLGYTPNDLRVHLENQFRPGMSWDTYGTWEIDHKQPIAAFHPSTPLSVINAMLNLQPLWKSENRTKGSKYVRV